jgi:xanthine dehydrogenase YagS FAD-binding subunit
MINEFAYARPTTLADADALLAEAGAAPLGGGTDLVVAMREELTRPDTLVDLTRVAGASELVWQSDGGLRIGGAVTVATLARDARIRDRFRALAEACESVGTPALRTMGTIGGNLCQRPRCWYLRSKVPCYKNGGTGCPAAAGENQYHAILGGGPCYIVHPSDPAVALTALEAIVEIRGGGAVRRVPIVEFFVLPAERLDLETVLGPGEYVSAVEVPASSAGGVQRYDKVMQRAGWDFALVSLAAVRRDDGAVRLVFGGVAPIPWRVSESVEEDVASGGLSEDDVATLAERALYDAKPLGKNAYKIPMAAAVLRRGITALIGGSA